MLDFKKEDIIIQPKVHKYTVVFLPGWTRSARSDLNIFKTVPFLENTRIRIMQPPHRQFSIDSTQTKPSWFSLHPQVNGSILPGLIEISRLIDEILEEEYELCKNIFLGGFSQGGATALYTGFITSTIPFLGIFALSCFYPLVKCKEERKNIPLFVYHGEKDELLDFEMLRRSALETFQTFNLQYESDKDLGHTYSWKEFKSLKKWMKKCINREKL